ncbi:hypothetical protein F511_10894 [Dorcoceras hygrometricum]|uniref:Uncharacterized protein n=1 Tax=Dorcoceras hygrometricum TaxID=472368 RepID=A0A2Z7CLC5_9LAMI|nr:hypothetical protein F511_10894 [Dorcoceras hygrometricum]
MWISAGERYRISNGVVLRNQSIVILPADSRYVDVSITVERGVDDVDFTVAFTRVFGISSSVIVLSLRYGFELVLRRGYDLDELLRGRAVIPHSHLPAGIVATMRRVVNYHSSWARQQQVELFDASGNPGSMAGRGFNPAGGAQEVASVSQ